MAAQKAGLIQQCRVARLDLGLLCFAFRIVTDCIVYWQSVGMAKAGPAWLQTLRIGMVVPMACQLWLVGFVRQTCRLSKDAVLHCIRWVYVLAALGCLGGYCELYHSLLLHTYITMNAFFRRWYATQLLSSGCRPPAGYSTCFFHRDPYMLLRDVVVIVQTANLLPLLTVRGSLPAW
jgi:hypothetical protein